MIDQHNLNKFNEIYNKTYNLVVKYVVCKCNNIDDVNDIIQDIYISLYKECVKSSDKIGEGRLQKIIIYVPKKSIK